jgi:two-component sensor histidine kinase
VSTPTPFTAGSRPGDLVTIATQLSQRTQGPDLRAEAAASARLSRMLASDPIAAQRCVLEIARDLCHAGTAGLSLLLAERVDGMTVRWELVRGALASYEGIEAMRINSPCGLCLDAGKTILVSRPSRAFAWLEGTHPPIVETLIVPLQDDTGQAHGTLWIAHHEPDAHCTSDDARILEQLAQQLMLALRLQEHAREAARALLFKQTMIDEVNHRTKNTLQAASSLLTMQANATSSLEVRRALLDSHARLQLLAQVHALLCIEPNDTQSVFMPRLLQVVCDALAKSFGHPCPGVQLEVSCDPISLPADDAIAIALLSNEVVTNAYKHAFANQASGEITVELQCCSSERAMVLRISDTGRGANLAHSKQGMGLKLMRLLSAQLRGALDVVSSAAEGGTQVTLKLARAADCDGVLAPVVAVTPGTAA